MNLNKKSKRTEALLTSFLHYQFKKHFYCIYLDDQRDNKHQAGAKLYLMNHSSWWDGLLIFYLNKTIMQEDAFAMMSKKGMEEFSFFEKIGAFPVDPSSPKDLIKALSFAHNLLAEKKSVWIFPQGREEHIEKRPFSYFNGPAYLMEKKEELEIILVGSYYSFRHDQRPELFLRIQDSLSLSQFLHLNRREKTDLLREKHEALVNSIRDDLIHERLGNYKTIKKGSKTASEWLQWMKKPIKKRSKA
ncbi:lysophospholipid acyltransferase family protein [Jeotgalibacillus proteolyticus]|uniref:Glycerol acyltransferase n=1 Tax=Jeotgalibacillus proteolyticus TaxID=2082395 RepID=A0A2S5GE75_9BACL|nr:lysophospholipid acyltransferase family protein [Jeotgalibacillus proteolyticus]PPA71183.1 glycerol acyltransferase [Jeotgalibacillus proteolyticus]